MQIVSQVAFILLVVLSLFLFSKKAKEIYNNIMLGRDEDISDEPGRRWKNVLLIALGQKKMFRNPVVAVLHLIIYAGFIIINAEVLEIALDGLFGRHRLFSGFMGSFYPIFINGFEILALLVLLSCVVFLARRNVVIVKRLRSKELDGWPKSDANYILITEIILMSLFLTMNAADTVLQQRGFGEYGMTRTGNFLISAALHPLLSSSSSDHSGNHRTHMLVAAHHRHFRISKLSTLFKTSAHYSCVSQHLLCKADSAGKNEEYA